MKVVAIPTEYRVEHLDYNYNFSKYDGKWTVTRWGINAPHIPPCTNILTNQDGWTSVMCNASHKDRMWFDNIESAVYRAVQCEQLKDITIG